MCDIHSCNPAHSIAVCCGKDCVRKAKSVESVPEDEFEAFYDDLMRDRSIWLEENNLK
jgi:hypothetical protein